MTDADEMPIVAAPAVVIAPEAAEKAQGAQVIKVKDNALRTSLIASGTAVCVALISVFGVVVINKLDGIHDLANNQLTVQTEAAKEANDRLDAALVKIEEQGKVIFKLEERFNRLLPEALQEVTPE